MSDVKPMAPKRLEQLRRTIDPIRFPGFVALLSHADYWQREAEQLTRERDAARRGWAEREASDRWRETGRPCHVADVAIEMGWGYLYPDGD